MEQAQALWYGEHKPTVNTTEMQALIDGLVESLPRLEGMPLVVIGDSKLVIDFCNGAARPQQTDLFLGLKEVRKLTRGLSVHYRHVPRSANKLADWLTNVARVARSSVEMTDRLRGCSATSEPPCAP